jgi:anaerobic magnesium-protoporphyrin IX monomethyl ester cyclase
MPEATLFSATLGEDKKLEPPLGPLYIASALEALGWSVDFRDYQLFDGANAFDPGAIVRCLAGHQPVLMMSCFVDMLPVVISAAEAIKSAKPETFIILGGPGPSARAKEIVELFPQLDAIVIGEGEETIKEWALTWADAQRGQNSLEPIAGMVLRREGRILEGHPRQRLSGAMAGIRPSYHLLDWPRYSAARIITTRGCPYACSFCDVANLWGRKAVYRDITSTVEEMIVLRNRYNRRWISIADDTFVLDRDRVRAFCELLIQKNADIEWGCFGRINLMSEDLIALMAKAGCRAIFYGIDSGSPDVLKRTFKELDPASIIPTLEMSAKYFDLIEASFIWGYPFESYEDFLLTLDLAAQASRLAPRVNVQLHMLSPLPNSPMYKQFAGELVPPEPKDRQWLLLPGLLLDPRAQGLRDIIGKSPDLFPGFFTFPTPDKAGKQAKLDEVVSALEGQLGQIMFSDSVRRLLAEHDGALEAELFANAVTAPERIGVGLALGVFRRTRRTKEQPELRPLEGSRGPSLIRERNDLTRIALS